MCLKTLLLASLFSFSPFGFSKDQAPVTTIPDLNLAQYVGRWHQIGAIPAWFQRKCKKNTAAQYTKSDDGLISVINSCEREDGEISTAEGIVRINPKFQDPSKLQVTFVSIFGSWFWIFGGDYWVIDIGKRDDHYEYSVVGDPKREYLWILGRNPQLSLETLKVIRDKIGAQGYDLSKIMVTQEGELNGKKLSTLE